MPSANFAMIMMTRRKMITEITRAVREMFKKLELSIKLSDSNYVKEILLQVTRPKDGFLAALLNDPIENVNVAVDVILEGAWGHQQELRSGKSEYLIRIHINQLCQVSTEVRQY